MVSTMLELFGERWLKMQLEMHQDSNIEIKNGVDIKNVSNFKSWLPNYLPVKKAKKHSQLCWPTNPHQNYDENYDLTMALHCHSRDGSGARQLIVFTHSLAVREFDAKDGFHNVWTQMVCGRRSPVALAKERVP